MRAGVLVSLDSGDRKVAIGAAPTAPAVNGGGNDYISERDSEASVKHYGIYLAYPPAVDIRAQGLGRYLAAFLKAAHRCDNVRFVVLCPSWSREAILKLFEDERVDIEETYIVSPDAQYVALRLYDKLKSLRDRTYRMTFLGRLLASAKSMGAEHIRWIETTLVQTKRIWVFSGVAIYWVLLAALAAAPLLVYVLIKEFTLFLKVPSRQIQQRPPISALADRLRGVWQRPEGDSFVYRLYRRMEQSEVDELVRIANSLSHVSAWYCPTAFWPSFNRIDAPRLLCVPDVVISDFPVAFAEIGGERTMETFEDICETIDGADRIVTYSDHVKWSTLVTQFHVSDKTVRTIKHAPNGLAHCIDVKGFPDSRAASKNYCESLFGAALRRSVFAEPAGFENTGARFLFYASQFRPNKNVLTLLRSYEHLLRQRFVQHKLVLTGDPWSLPEIAQFILERRLQHDVLCLKGLNVSELAACYRLADLSICPSLSEGGCPFTFTEALSVGTPVLMSRIPVALEVLDDAPLRETMFFDPYDWRDMVRVIEWGLLNREELLRLQRPVFKRLSQRTWNDVVAEHIDELDALCS
ncbi:glycosyltransferase [Thiocapsa marina]|uniref:Glycosyl transferase group 1 n=1 Tax=Thiocapsa marina 5811 TaxID=768671 RepID=F9U6Y3_9GAMM|nr:glycosyltransferase [Thiocapsa marina]EGV20009.1 glycosyl transferase group 1 [Thiocapsa marina 5811]